MTYTLSSGGITAAANESTEDKCSFPPSLNRRLIAELETLLNTTGRAYSLSELELK